MKPLAAFPPPPDIEPAADFAPLEFVRSGGGYQAKLGALVLGHVRAAPAGVRLSYWSSLLPGGPTMRPCTSLDTGRERLAGHIRDWFVACGHPLPDPSKVL